ncbi:MAG: arginine deiminase family protein [Paludibacteraceae bacterium]|nr:arginine deiminase family protein [Paludibacteraceae bacterium]
MARNQFASKFGTIAAIAGSAVGLGNIWKFPYVAGQNGGAAFLIIYIVISILISVPVMLSEFVIGRRGQGNAYRSFINSSGKKGWGSVGAIEIFAGMVILAFYCVVAGWSLEYIMVSITHNFSEMSATEMTSMFGDFVNSWRPVLWTIVFLALNCVVLAFGVSKGIERCSKFMIPALFLILLFLAIVSFSLEGWKAGALFLLKPNWGAVTGQTIIMALGQSFFSLSLGMSAMITYGSYIQKDQSLVSVSGIVTGATVLMAVLAGLAIFPSTFTYGVEVTSGPNLVFVTLPPLFARMPAGNIVSVLFFVLLLFAAITSSFSLLEAGAAYISEEWKVAKKPVGRVPALIILFVVIGVLSVICARSQVEGSTLKILGWTVFDFTDMFTSNFILPLGGIAACILVGQLMKRDVVFNELTSDGQFNAKVVSFFYWLARFVCPIIIFFMFINGVSSIQRPVVEEEMDTIAADSKYPAAEFQRATMALVHTPGDELFEAIVHPRAGLFDDYFDVNLAAEEHLSFVKVMEDNGVKVYNLREVLMKAPREELKPLVMQSITYNPEDEEYKNHVVDQMSVQDMVDCILLRPTVNLTENELYTGSQADYHTAPLSNIYFMRDQSIITKKGIIMGHMNEKQRENESAVLELCYRVLGVAPIYRITGDDAFLEGGDYMPFHTMSIIGCSQLTTMPAINQLMKNDLLDYDRVVVVHFDSNKENEMYLDNFFNIIDKDLVTISEDHVNAKRGDADFLTCDIYLRKAIPNDTTGLYILQQKDADFCQLLRDREITIIPVPSADIAKMANNYLTIGPRHICAMRGMSRELAEAIQNHKVTIEWIDAENLMKGFGAAHGMTQIIKRSWKD